MHRGQRNRINLGSSIFRDFIEKDLLYVDKSAFIEHVLGDWSDVLLFTRPRRMGKSLNLDMLRTFLDLKQDAAAEGLFAGLYIEGSPAFAQAGKYPVISLNFRDLPREAYAKMLVINVMDQAARYLTPDQYSDKLKKGLEDTALATQSLRFLTENLYAVYGVKPFVLIDEYDKLVMDSAGTPEFDAVRAFTKGVLSAALKDNPSLGKGILTGVNRIAQESLFSDLNNIEVYGVLRESAYDTDYGFTEGEVRELCTADELKEVREWYNGYRVGREKMYFTYSVMSYLKSDRLDNYWGQSGVMDSIRKAMTFERFEALTKAINGFGSEHISADINADIKDRLTADDMLGYTGDDAFYSLLVQTGYMTYDPTESFGKYKVYLPNRELQDVWRDFILNRFYRGRLQRVEDALAQAAEPERFSAALTELLSDRLSYFDMEAREPEKTYHVFVLGLLASAGIRCLSNRESGFGRYDLLAVFPDKSIVFEFKQTGEATKIGEAADEAFRQIIDRKYADGASEGLPVYGVGIGFHNKTCAVKTAQIRK